jgi:hypothetical protein
MRLLMIQADRKRPIMDILIEQGALTPQKAASEMAAYRRSLQPRPRTTSGFKATLRPHLRDTTRLNSDERITV